MRRAVAGAVGLSWVLAAALAGAGHHGPARVAMPFTAGQVWVGRYRCGQGLTNLMLRVTNVSGTHVEMVFAFNVATAGVVGQYTMAGEYQSARSALALTPGAWVVQPPRYEMVGISGQVSPDGHRFSGSVGHPSCQTFDVALSP